MYRCVCSLTFTWRSCPARLSLGQEMDCWFQSPLVSLHPCTRQAQPCLRLPRTLPITWLLQHVATVRTVKPQMAVTHFWILCTNYMMWFLSCLAFIHLETHPLVWSRSSCLSHCCVISYGGAFGLFPFLAITDNTEGTLFYMTWCTVCASLLDTCLRVELLD